MPAVKSDKMDTEFRKNYEPPGEMQPPSFLDEILGRIMRFFPSAPKPQSFSEELQNEMRPTPLDTAAANMTPSFVSPQTLAMDRAWGLPQYAPPTPRLTAFGAESPLGGLLDKTEESEAALSDWGKNGRNALDFPVIEGGNPFKERIVQAVSPQYKGDVGFMSYKPLTNLLAQLVLPENKVVNDYVRMGPSSLGVRTPVSVPLAGKVSVPYQEKYAFGGRDKSLLDHAIRSLVEVYRAGY